MNNLNINLGDNIDEDFFGTLKGSPSKLQQLFVDETLSSNDNQQSFKYQYQKDNTASSNTSTPTLIAKVVTAFRNGEFQGKVGLALVQNSFDMCCNLIIYKTKVNILANLKLEPGKDLLYKQTRYWQFYDDHSIYWSFSFDSTLHENEFLDTLYIKSITFKECEENSKVTQKNNLELSKFYLEADNVGIEELTRTAAVDSISENKNSIIKRIVKMGKPLPILPDDSSPQFTTEFSDSSDAEVIETPTVLTHKRFQLPRNHKTPIDKPYQQLIPSTVGMDTVPTSANPVYSLNALESKYMQMLLTEQRTQSSEIRININKIENKIEKVLDKLEYGRNDRNKNTEKEDDILELEEKLLMLKKENRKLKQNFEHKSAKESEESQIKELLYEFKDDLQKLNISYKQDLKPVLKELIYKVKESYNNVKETQLERDEKELNLKEIKSEFELKMNENVGIQNEVHKLKQREKDLELQLIEKDTEITKHKQELLDLQSKLKINLENVDEVLIKSIMNNLYADIAEILRKSDFSRSEDILPIIASVIKKQTLNQIRPKEN